MITLSEAALELLRTRLSGRRVDVTPENRAEYRELAEARFMEPVHTFARGRDSHYRLTLKAVEIRDGVIASTPAPSPGVSAATLG